MSSILFLIVITLMSIALPYGAHEMFQDFARRGLAVMMVRLDGWERFGLPTRQCCCVLVQEFKRVRIILILREYPWCPILGGKNAFLPKESRVEFLQFFVQLERDVFLAYFQGAYVKLADSDTIDDDHVHGFRVVV